MSLFLGDSVDGEQEAFGVTLGLGAGNNFLDRRVGDELEELVLALYTKQTRMSIGETECGGNED
jgi:hypothetical protein